MKKLPKQHTGMAREESIQPKDRCLMFLLNTSVLSRRLVAVYKLYSCRSHFCLCFCSTTSSVDGIAEDAGSENEDDDLDSEVAALCGSRGSSRASCTSSGSRSRASAPASPTPAKKKKRTSNESESDSILQALVNRVEAEEKTDHVHDFLIGYASTLRKFPPLLLAKTKKRIGNVISDAEIEMMEQSDYQNIAYDPVPSPPDYRYDTIIEMTDDDSVEILNDY